jgi:photosystem II stability/assembly factor-like uncharacterized protein
MTWTAQNVDPSYHLRKICMVDAEVGWVGGGPRRVGEAGPNVLLETADGGDSWDYQDPGNILNAVAFADADTGCYVIDRTIYRTTDGGDHWTEGVSNAPSWFATLFYTDARTAWAAGAQGYLARSDDAGRTWVPQSSGTSRNIRDLCVLDSSHAWYVARIGVISTSRDDGVTWTFQNSGTTEVLASVSFANAEVGWAVGAEGGIYKTVTGGEG